ncbi:hypothetical protein LJR013_003182 [Pseudarthrobacter oxydans]|uniref:hypothetical protein n=1 Tax=Pseudarthrobacter oxydans TaxID=1671 RepID=UPI003ECC87F4
MAVETTPMGFTKPDNAELVKFGAFAITLNAQRSDELFTAAQTQLAAVQARIGVAEANIDAGTGGGPGLVEDPLNPGTYFMADTSPITEDPANPGLYTF